MEDNDGLVLGDSRDSFREPLGRVAREDLGRAQACQRDRGGEALGALVVARPDAGLQPASLPLDRHVYRHEVDPDTRANPGDRGG
jgi:hypothetical protein